jgi:hypothetical protein
MLEFSGLLIIVLKFLSLLGPCLFISPIGSLKIVLVWNYTPSSKIMFCTYVFYLVF